MIEEKDSGAGPFDRTYRCSICTLDWPPYEEFEVCASCGDPCTPFSHMKPMALHEAHKLKTAYAFEDFYERWDREHDPARLRPDFRPDN